MDGISLLLALTAGGAVASEPAPVEPSEQIEVVAAPDFSLPDLKGEQVSLSGLKGKVVVMSFWATWCGPCKEEMPHLQRMADEHGSDGLVVLAISTDDARSRGRVKPFVRRNGYTFEVLLDRDSTVFTAYHPARTLPYTVVVDRQGDVVERKLGYDPGDEVALEATLESLLAAPSPP
ncbi:MAG: TlpA family protein disulfide reductase [Myxococcales bacterium]|nr:TlpA family protein disulfide reductase [Myxococcales bacterium]